MLLSALLSRFLNKLPFLECHFTVRASAVPERYLLCRTWCVCSSRTTVGKLWLRVINPPWLGLMNCFMWFTLWLRVPAQHTRRIMGPTGCKQSPSAYQILSRSGDSSAVCSRLPWLPSWQPERLYPYRWFSRGRLCWQTTAWFESCFADLSLHSGTWTRQSPQMCFFYGCESKNNIPRKGGTILLIRVDHLTHKLSWWCLSFRRSVQKTGMLPHITQICKS